jgi:hypothetical protein
MKKDLERVRNKRKEFQEYKNKIISKIEVYRDSKDIFDLTNDDIQFFLDTLDEVYLEENQNSFVRGGLVHARFLRHPRYRGSVYDRTILKKIYTKESAECIYKENYRTYNKKCDCCDHEYIGAYIFNTFCCQECFIILMLKTNP